MREYSMTSPIRASDNPFAITVESGKKYFWCACGKSANQPFCDGSHSGTSFAPIIYTATEDKKIFFCGCKATKNAPLCDGSHKNE